MAAITQSYGHRDAQTVILQAFADSYTGVAEVIVPQTVPLVAAVKSGTPFSAKVRHRRVVNVSHQVSSLTALAFVFQGVRDKGQVGILIENILTYWYPRVIGFVVPLFQTVSDLFLGDFLNSLSTTFAVYSTGLRHLTLKSLQEAFQVINGLLDFEFYDWSYNHRNSTVLSGHMQGGVIAKTLAAASNFSGVGFECPILANSPASAYAATSVNIAAGFRLVNVFSDSSLFTASEANISMNVHIPMYQSYFKPANPYETFCMLNAGCTFDDRADVLCSKIVGAGRYEHFFRQWGRDRSPVKIRY
jgi:hypothetical protein